MSSQNRKILVADLLCGAGGSSTGCARALRELGLDMELVCVNHWPVAIDTHQRNHPEARHYVQDIASVRPHIIVPEGYLDLLMASPTCTHHSVARGGKPTSDQQRSDPWHIITWLTELRVRRIIIENVWEFTGWGPVDPNTGKPIKSRKGEYFNAWIDVIRRLGFDPEWRKLNAADYGDATTRQRFILMARSDRRRVIWPAATHTRPGNDKLAPFPGLKPWRPAREIIDWSKKGKSIFGRKKPLAAKTLARIEAGAVKFGWPEPYLVILRRHMDGRSVDAPLPALATGGHVALAQPIVLSRHSEGAPRSIDEPTPTQVAKHSHMLIEPFLATVAHGSDPEDPTADIRRAKSIDHPLGTVQAGGGKFALISPYYGSGSGETCTDAGAPLPTITAKNRFGLVVPVTQSGGGAGARPLEQPVPTMTTAKGGEFALVMPVTHDDGSDRARAADDPLPTITGANRGELAFIVAQHGERPGQTPRVHDIDLPAPTIAATGHVDLIEPGQHFDILFRMLEPEELGAAMGFDDEDQIYEFAGTKTQKIKQIGNAVSVRKMQACVRSIMADAVPGHGRIDAEPAIENLAEDAA